MVAYDRLRPAPDRDREERALDAMSDAESLEEAWERLIARGLIPTSWIDAAQRRFYAVSNRCARCGHPLRCRLARCLHDERKEPTYASGPSPGSLWDLLVIAGHFQRFIDAEAQAEERETLAPSPMRSPSRIAWSYEVALPQPVRWESFSRRQQPLIRRAIELVEARTGRLFEQCTPFTNEDLVAWFEAQRAGNSPPPLADRLRPHTQFLGQVCGWSTIRFDLSPTPELARRLPRALPLTR